MSKNVTKNVKFSQYHFFTLENSEPTPFRILTVAGKLGSRELAKRAAEMSEEAGKHVFYAYFTDLEQRYEMPLSEFIKSARKA